MAASRELLTNATDSCNCSICLETYRLPRSLPCLHTFCESCLQAYIDDVVQKDGLTENCFACPVCRKPCKPNDDMVKHTLWSSCFPINYALLSLLDAPMSSMSQQNCVPCLAEDKTKAAVKFCLECEESICDDCVKSHQKFKKMKGHRLTDLTDIGHCQGNVFSMDKIMSICKLHKQKTLEYFCKDDESLCCATCAIVNHRKCQDVVAIAEAAIGIKDGIAIVEFKTDMESLKKDVNDVSQHLKENGSKFDEQIEKVSVNFSQAKDAVVSAMNKLEKDISWRCKELHKTEKMKATEQLNNCERIGTALEGTLNMGDAIVKHGTDSEVFIFLEKMKKQKTTYEKMSRNAQEVMHLVTLVDGIEKLQNILLKQIKISTLLKLKKGNPNVKSRAFMKQLMVECISVITLKVDKYKPKYSGACEFPNGNVLLVCPKYGSVDLFDATFKFLSRVETGSTWKIAAVDEESALVTSTSDKFLHKIKLRPNTNTLERERVELLIKAPFECISKADRGDIILSTTSNTLYTFSSDCKSQIGKAMDHDKTGRVFKSFHHFKVIPSSTLILQSCEADNAVYCFDYLDGSPHFKYVHKELSGPAGIDTDKWSCIYICGQKSHNIHQLMPSGELLNIICVDSLESPLNLFFLHGGEEFIVTSSTKYKTLHKFKICCV